MNKFLFLLSCCTAVVVCIDLQYDPYYYGDLYPNYPYADAPLEPSPYYIGSSQNNRLFWTGLFTTTTTTTSTTTCTVSTSVTCAGRRRRFADFLAVEEGAIEPTSVDKVEVTPVAEMDSSVRKERKANPQLAYYRDMYFPGTFQPQPTFGLRYYSTYPRLYNRPVVAVDPANQRLFFRVTSTVTSTTTARSTPACSSSSSFNAC